MTRKQRKENEGREHREYYLSLTVIEKLSVGIIEFLDSRHSTITRQGALYSYGNVPTLSMASDICKCIVLWYHVTFSCFIMKTLIFHGTTSSRRLGLLRRTDIVNS